MPNPHVVSFLKRLESRYSIDAVDMPMSKWIEANTRLKGRQFSFKRYEFQRAIVDDLHPNMDVVKCSQVGLTEVQLRKVLAFLRRNNGTSAIFTLPNEKMFKRVSKTRVKPLLDDNKVFQPEGEEKNTRSMDLMQFGQSFLYVTGATEGDATSIPADMVLNDEVDLTDQEMLALFASRMQNSDWKIGQRFSTPTFMDYGIDLGYGNSDQLEYVCKCLSCNHYNIPDFDAKFLKLPGLKDEHAEDLSLLDLPSAEQLDLANAIVICEKCGAPLDLDNPDIREWVPRHPSRSQVARGYRIRPFCTSRIDIPYIIAQLLKYKERDYIRGWYNTVLGRPYTDANARLTEALIRANFVGAAQLPIDSDTPCFVGIDAGLMCHVTVGTGPLDKPVNRFFLQVPAHDIVQWAKDFCANHKVVAGAMDRHPYTPTADAVFEVSGRKIFPVEYRGQKEIHAVKNPLDETEVIYFQANRTMMIDDVARLVRSKNLPMAGYGHNDHLVVEHLMDMVRDETPEEPAVWRKLTGKDHYFHSLAFQIFARKITTLLALLDDSDKRTTVIADAIQLNNRSDGLVGHGSNRNSTKRRVGFR